MTALLEVEAKCGDKRLGRSGSQRWRRESARGAWWGVRGGGRGRGGGGGFGSRDEQVPLLLADSSGDVNVPDCRGWHLCSLPHFYSLAPPAGNTKFSGCGSVPRVHRGFTNGPSPILFPSCPESWARVMSLSCSLPRAPFCEPAQRRWPEVGAGPHKAPSSRGAGVAWDQLTPS